MDSNVKGLLWLAGAGMGGSFVGWWFFRPKKKPRTSSENLGYLISGLLVAFFVSPFACKWFHVSDVESARFVTFAIGVLWTKILDRYTEGFKNIKLPGVDNK